MAITTLGNTLETPPSFGLSTVAGVSAGTTLYIRTYLANWAGVSNPSTVQSITPTTGEGIEITIPTTYRRPSDSPDFVVVEGSTSAVGPFRQLAVIRLKTTTGVDVALPVTETLTTAEATNPSVTVPDIADLATLVTPEGKRVFVISNASWYQYYGTYSQPLSGSAVVAGPAGVFVQVNGPSPAVLNLNAQGGLYSSPLSPLLFIPYAYAEDGNDSYPLTLLLRNGFGSSLPTIPQGTKIAVQPYLNGSPAAAQMTGKIKVQLLGYANPTTGTFTPISSPSVLFNGARNDLLSLPSPLPSGHAAVYQVVLNYTATDLPNVAPNASLAITLGLYTQGGTPAPWTEFFGDQAADQGQDRRCLPGSGLFAGVGSGFVAVGQLASGFQEATSVGPLATNTPSQNAVIDGNGTVHLAASPNAAEAQWAEISTELTYGNWVYANDVIPATASSIDVTFDNPYTVAPLAPIRADYPDQTIATFEVPINASSVAIGLYDWDNDLFYVSTFAISGAVSQTVTLSSLGTLVVDPFVQDLDAGFHTPTNTVGALAGAGSIPALATGYEVYIAYYYDGTVVSAINNLLPVSTSGGGSGGILIGDDPPTLLDGSTGSVWLDTETGKLYQKGPAAWSEVFDIPTVSEVRPKLTASLVYYVDQAAGSDTNPGTGGLPFATLQKALDSATAWDRGPHSVSIRLAVGDVYTTNDAFFLEATPGSKPIELRVDSNNTVDRATITSTTDSPLVVVNGAWWELAGLTLNATGAPCIRMLDDSKVNLDLGMTFSAAFGAQIQMGQRCSVKGDLVEITLAGGVSAGSFLTADHNCTANLSNCIFTASGSLTYSSFVRAWYNSTLLFQGTTFSGTYTGTRFNANFNSTIRATTATTLPGTVAGTTANFSTFATI